MENPREEHQYHLFLRIFLTLCLLSTSISANTEKEQEDEFDYIEGSKRGPEHWGELKEEWTKCKDGSLQSPIALSRKSARVNTDLGNLNRSYKPGNATLKNSGHQIAVEWAGNVGSIQINGTDYLLQRCHWHHPSEHTINGERLDLELHMVHATNSPNVASKMVVVAVLFHFGLSDPFLSKVAGDLKLLNLQGKDEIEVGSLDPSDAIAIIHGHNKSYYIYLGSLTTPPCSEPIIWIVTEQINSVSPVQVELLMSIVDKGAKRNARPLQELNHRDVFFYDSSEAKTPSQG